MPLLRLLILQSRKWEVSTSSVTNFAELNSAERTLEHSSCLRVASNAWCSKQHDFSLDRWDISQHNSALVTNYTVVTRHRNLPLHPEFREQLPIVNATKVPFCSQKQKMKPRCFAPPLLFHKETWLCFVSFLHWKVIFHPGVKKPFKLMTLPASCFKFEHNFSFYHRWSVTQTLSQEAPRQIICSLCNPIN